MKFQYTCEICGDTKAARTSVQKRCRECNAEAARRKARKWLSENKERSKAAKKDSYWRDVESSREKDRARYEKRKEAVKERARKHYLAKRDQILERLKSDEGREKARLRERRKRQDPVYRVHSNLSATLRASLRGEKRGRKWEALVGYTLETLASHLERQFVNGMSWENYGKWHIDHVIPRRSFLITSPDCPEFKACWALSNLRPVWAAENLRKQGRRELLL
jgi:hypothetical protein